MILSSTVCSEYYLQRVREYGYPYWKEIHPNPWLLTSAIFCSSGTVIFACTGLLAVKRPKDVHWHLVLFNDCLSLVLMILAAVVGQNDCRCYLETRHELTSSSQSIFVACANTWYDDEGVWEVAATFAVLTLISTLASAIRAFVMRPKTATRTTLDASKYQMYDWQPEREAFGGPQAPKTTVADWAHAGPGPQADFRGIASPPPMSTGAENWTHVNPAPQVDSRSIASPRPMSTAVANWTHASPPPEADFRSNASSRPMSTAETTAQWSTFSGAATLPRQSILSDNMKPARHYNAPSLAAPSYVSRTSQTQTNTYPET